MELQKPQRLHMINHHLPNRLGGGGLCNVAKQLQGDPLRVPFILAFHIWPATAALCFSPHARACVTLAGRRDGWQ